MTACVLGGSPTPAAHGAQHPPEGHQMKEVPAHRASVGRRDAGRRGKWGAPPTEARRNGYVAFRSLAQGWWYLLPAASGARCLQREAVTRLRRWRAVIGGRTTGMNIRNQTYGDQLGCRQNGPITATTSLGIW